MRTPKKIENEKSTILLPIIIGGCALALIFSLNNKTDSVPRHPQSQENIQPENSIGEINHSDSRHNKKTQITGKDADLIIKNMEKTAENRTQQNENESEIENGDPLPTEQNSAVFTNFKESKKFDNNQFTELDHFLENYYQENTEITE